MVDLKTWTDYASQYFQLVGTPENFLTIHSTSGFFNVS